jgi:hypothetical protein
MAQPRLVVQPQFIHDMLPPRGGKAMESSSLGILAQLGSAMIGGASSIIVAYITVAHAKRTERQSTQENREGKPHFRRPLLALAILVVGWIAAGALAMPLAITVEQFLWASAGMAGAVGWALGGALAGVTSAQGLRLMGFRVKLQHVIVMTIGWAAAGILGGGLSWNYSPSLGGEALGGALGGTAGGIVTGHVLRHLDEHVPTERLAIIAVGWAIGGAVGSLLSWLYLGYFGLTVYVIAGAVTGGIIGAIGGGLMLFELSAGNYVQGAGITAVQRPSGAGPVGTGNGGNNGRRLPRSRRAAGLAPENPSLPIRKRGSRSVRKPSK